MGKLHEIARLIVFFYYAFNWSNAFRSRFRLIWERFDKECDSNSCISMNNFGSLFFGQRVVLFAGSL